MKGKIVKFFSFKRCGFIEITETSDLIYFHKSDYPEHEKPSIGQLVEFIIVQTPKGEEAKDINVIKPK